MKIVGIFTFFVPLLIATTVASAAQPLVYIFGSVSGLSGKGPAGSQCTFESQGTSALAFNTTPDGTILMTGFYIDRQEQRDLTHSTYYGIASFTPTSSEMTFDMFRSTDGGLHYPVHTHDYHQTTDSAGNIHLAMRLVVAECLMVVEATYHPLGGNPVFP